MKAIFDLTVSIELNLTDEHRLYAARECGFEGEMAPTSAHYPPQVARLDAAIRKPRPMLKEG